MAVKGEYLGLPLPNYEEGDLLQHAIEAGREGIGLSPEDLCDLVYAQRPLIRRIIDLDMRLFAQEDAPDDMPREVIDISCAGIQAGYEFMIGCLSYVYFLRSDYTSLTNFFVQQPKHSPVLPVRKHSQLNRVVQCMNGEAPLDPHIYSALEITDSSEMSLPLAADFLYEAMAFDDAVTNEMQRLEEHVGGPGNEDIEPLLDGFRRGVDGTILMYVQSHEQALLNLLGSMPTYKAK